MDRGLDRCFARPFKNKRISYERVEKFISPLYFSDVNLYSRLYPVKNTKPEILGHYSADVNRFMKYEEVIQKQFSSAKVGDSFGPTWSTHWFKLVFIIPKSWKGEEVRLRWNSNSEAMVWKNGNPCQGLTGGDGQVRTDYILTQNAQGDERVELYIEMAANGMFGAGKDGMINPPDPTRSFMLSMVEIAVFNRKAYEIIRDLKLLLSMIKELPDDNQRGWQALYAANDVVNCFQPETNDSYLRATEILNKFFRQRNGDSQHVVHAVGHCHIDTAWLWPYDETIRKCGRSWSSVIDLMKRNPDFKFVCSQAQQFEWVKKYYPTIYSDVKYFVKKGQFIPVGGTWVEMDGNLPSGESFVRQFLYGQRFFEKEFGTKCEVFWLPDTFGYSAQLPQIMKQCGIKYFVTQKLSWNLINKFPHSTFLWEGIDGTRCLTHFPPAETYESNAGVDDVLKSSTNNKDKGRANDSLLLFGFGDGGGGPTEDMIENLKRLEDVDGVPRVKLSNPLEFFGKIEPVADKLNVWAEELYLELHQGTFTTHSELKKRNRYCEEFLCFTESMSVISWVSSGRMPENYPSEKLLDCWKLLLLNQFHDVLPGTSIKQVYDQAVVYYNEILQKLRSITEVKGLPKFIYNPHSWSIRRVLRSSHIENGKYVQLGKSDWNLCMQEIPSMGYSIIEPKPTKDIASISKCGESQDHVILENGVLKALFDKCGRIISLKLKDSKREVFGCQLPGNQYVLFDDIPLYWDAWDVMPYYRETRKTLDETTDLSVLDEGPLRASFQVSMKISENSYIKQTVVLEAESPYLAFNVEIENWKENRKFLRVEFPVDVHSQFASYDIQFGHVKRPTHGNTSWDWAKYEVCGHKWVDISEYDFGVALLNNCKYGFSVTGNTISMSLLRSPKSPDNLADMGAHSFAYAIMPHKGTFQSAGVIQRAYEFSRYRMLYQPMEENAKLSQSFFEVTSPAVIIEAVKKAEDIENAIIVRLYEAYGGKASTTLTTAFNVQRVARCNMLEELLPGIELVWSKEKGCKIDFNPFEIISLVLYLK